MDLESTVQNFSTELFVWGNNKEWQCGTNDIEYLEIPMKIYVPIIVRQAVCGRSHTVLSTNEGQIYTYGSNKFGQLGIGINQNTINYSVPQIVKQLQSTNCTKIAAGQNHTLSLADDGIAYGWGQSDQGQLGVLQDCIFDPVQLTESHRFVNLIAGEAFSVFQKETEEILLCGQNFIDISNVDYMMFNTLEVEFQIQDICTGRECLLILSTTNDLYVILSEIEKIKLPMTNIQCLYSAFNPLICLEDNSLYQYSNGQVIRLNASLGCSIVECSQGNDKTLVIDENNVVYQIDNNQMNEIQELKDQDIRIVSAGYDHFIAVGQITKQNKNNFKLQLQPCQKNKNNKDQQQHSIENPKLSQSSSILYQPDNMLFSFSMKKDINSLTHNWQKKESRQKQKRPSQFLYVNQSETKLSFCSDLTEHKSCQTDMDHTRFLQSQIKQLEAELLTLREEGTNAQQIFKENKQLKRQHSIQQRNLEFQLQYQQTLQEQIQRLIAENEKQKKSQSPPQKNTKKQQIIQEIYEKQANLRGLIQSFYNDHHKAIALIRQSQY